MTITHIEYIDHGAQGEFGFFGKVVATSNVRGMSDAEVAAEIRSMKALLGDHVATREVISIPAVWAAQRKGKD